MTPALLARQQPQIPQIPEAIRYSDCLPRAFAKLPFRGIAPEKELQIGVPKHETDPRLQLIVMAWQRFLDNLPRRLYATDTYDKALEITRGIHGSASELKGVVTFLSGFDSLDNFDRIAGLFIMALVNDGCDSAYCIETKRFRRFLYHLGYYNEKDVIIDGDVGWGAGEEMRSGHLIIRGSVREVKWLDDSLIAGCFLGSSMRGGEIIVEGHGGRDVGYSMYGGVIRIHGGCENIHSYIHGGRIFVSGVQKYPPLEVV